IRIRKKDFLFLGKLCIILTNCFLHLAGGAFRRRKLCAKLNGRCEAECLSFEVKIGGCRAELTQLCCKKKQKH
uniref:Beta-defensin n=1 Tax=Marmota marmota marmota TaxID=9994 RepID=A0A8C6EZ52_MARMA